jgi:hypothetical protein
MTTDEDRAAASRKIWTNSMCEEIERALSEAIGERAIDVQVLTDENGREIVRAGDVIEIAPSPEWGNSGLVSAGLLWRPPGATRWTEASVGAPKDGKEWIPEVASAIEKLIARPLVEYDAQHADTAGDGEVDASGG